MLSFNTLFIIQLLLAFFLPVIAVPRPQASASPASSSSYWVSTITRQGTVAYGNDSSYQVFRNVMSFGAKGMAVSKNDSALGQLKIRQVTE
jgi:glucan 1,3-beta-glucosidase